MAGKQRHPEEALQRQVAELLDLLGWLWWHTPNGGARGRTEAGRLNGLGVKAGVPDIIIAEGWLLCDDDNCDICWGRDSGFLIAIELKSRRGTVRDSQRQWLDGLAERGALTAVCRSFEEVKAVLRHVNPLNGRRLP